MKDIIDNRSIDEKLQDITVVVASHKLSEAVILFTKCWLRSSSSKKFNLVIGYDKDWNSSDIEKIKKLYDKVYDVSDVYDAQKKFYSADREVGFSGKVGVIRKLVKTRYAIWVDDDIEILGDITPFLVPYFNSNKWIGIPRYRSMNTKLYDSGFENGFYQKHNTQNGFYIVDTTSQQFNEYADFMSCGKMFDDEIGLLKYYNDNVKNFNDDTFDIYDRSMFETTDAIKDGYYTWKHPERFAQAIESRNVIIKHWAGRPLKRFYLDHMNKCYGKELHDIILLYCKKGVDSKQENYDILEVEYVVNSIKKYCSSFVNRIIVVGDDVPSSIKNDIVLLPCGNPYKHCKDANIIHKIRYACENVNDLTDDFLVVSDDQVVTKESNWDDFTPRLNKNLVFSKALMNKDGWKKQLYHTLEQFNTKNVFEPHIWSPMNKNKFLEMCKKFDYEHNTNCIVFSLYYNFIGQKAVRNFDHLYFSTTMSVNMNNSISSLPRHIAWTDKAFENKIFRDMLDVIVGFKTVKKENTEVKHVTKQKPIVKQAKAQSVLQKNTKKSKLEQLKEDIRDGKIVRVNTGYGWVWKRVDEIS